MRFQEGMNISKWPSNFSAVLVRNIAAFCHCPKLLPQAKLKCFGSVSLAEEISRQLSVVTVRELLVISLIQIYCVLSFRPGTDN